MREQLATVLGHQRRELRCLRPYASQSLIDEVEIVAIARAGPDPVEELDRQACIPHKIMNPCEHAPALLPIAACPQQGENRGR